MTSVSKPSAPTTTHAISATVESTKLTNAPKKPPRTLPTPVDVRPLQYYLRGYPQRDKQYLLDGFVFGFPLEYFGPRSRPLIFPPQPNDSHFPIIHDKLQQEIEAGRVAGPFSSPPYNNLFLSPLYAVPKKLPGKFRLIHDLSHPKGLSVNDGIPPELSSVTYSSIDTAIGYIKSLGPGCYLAKTDIESAFRLIPIHPHDYHLLGFYWNGNFYFDKCLPMGSSMSCAIFESFSSALEWIARTKLHIRFPTHILDDFLFAAKTYRQCYHDLNTFSNMCKDVGVPLAEGKTYTPDTTMSFLGIELDTVVMEARLPLDKLTKCQDQLSSFLGLSSATLKQIQSLVGLLNHVCQVVPPGRAFLRRLIDLTKSQSPPNCNIPIPQHVRRDLHMWYTFLKDFNGRSFFLDERFISNSTLHLYTDAAASLGYGAVCGTAWFYGSWPTSLCSRNITILEFYPIVVALHVWGQPWANHSILLHTDNESLVHIINRQTSKNPLIMPLVRRFVLICLRRNILYRATHVPGKQNIMADTLSRLQINRFQADFQHMDPHPTTIPPHLQPNTLIGP